MEGALEGDDARAACRLLGELDRVLDCLGAGVGEHDLVQALRHDAGELLGQLEHRAVTVDVHLRVRHLGGLLLHGLDDLGVAVAGVDDGDADDEVEPLAAVGVVDPAPLGVVDGDRRHRPKEVGHVLHVRGLVRHVVTSSCDGAACVIVTRPATGAGTPWHCAALYQSHFVEHVPGQRTRDTTDGLRLANLDNARRCALLRETVDRRRRQGGES